MGASVRVATVDWPKVVAEIRGGGLMVKAIAHRVGIAPTSLHNLVSGATKEPCYSVGVRLLDLRDRVAQ
jgi:ribosomal protein S9